MDRMTDTIIRAADELDALGKRDLAGELDQMLSGMADTANQEETGLSSVLIRAADALDNLGMRDLASEFDALIKKAARQPKPRHKVGDQVTLQPGTKLAIQRVQLHPHFGPSYLLQIWVLEKDLPQAQQTLGEGLAEEDADDKGRDIGPTPRLPSC